MKMDAGTVEVQVEAEVVARRPEGWTMKQLWDALVEAGNDPSRMAVLTDEDAVLVYTTKETP